MNKRLPEFDAVIFDMDGVVLDSEPSYIFAWRQAAQECGTGLDDEFVQGLFGQHSADVERAMAKKIGEDFDRDRFWKQAELYWWAHIETHGIPPMPGVDEMLELLDSICIPYALATNSDDPYARECLRRGGLEDCFAVVVTRDQVAAGKPEPDLFQEAARRLGVPIGQCLVLEDSATGLLAARRAGAIPVLVLSRPTPQDSKDLAVACFRSLREATENIRTRVNLFPTRRFNLRRKS